MNQYKWFELPGIGLFTAKEDRAFIDHISQRIYPAKLVVQYEDADKNRSEEMIMHILNETGYTQNELEQELANLSFYLTESLKTDDQVLFEPYGILSKLNQEIQFRSTGKNLHTEFFGMGGLTLKPIVQKFVRSDDERVVPIKPIETNSLKKYKNLLWIIGALWVVFLLLLFYPTCNSCNKKSTKQNNHNSNESIIKQNQIQLEKNKQDSILRIQQLHEAYIADSIINANKAKEALNNSKPDSANNNNTKEPYLNETEIKDDNINLLNQQIKNKKCIIIVGSFLNKNNALKLQKKVKRNGYTPYTAPYKNYHRVGVRFDCMSRDLHEVLSELKQKYDNQSWILKY